MVVYDLTKCKNYSEDYTNVGEYSNTDFFCLEEMTDKRPIKHGDTIKFPNKKEYVVEFVPGELAVKLLKKESHSKKKIVLRPLPTVFFYHGPATRTGNGRDQYAYELMVEDAECFMRHGDLMVTNDDKFKGSCFVDIDKKNKEFRIVINPDMSGSGYFSIPLELSERVDNTFEYFAKHIAYAPDNNIGIDIGSHDKVFDVILHPSILKERDQIIAGIYNNELNFRFGEKDSDYMIPVDTVYKLLRKNEVVRKVWSKIPTLPVEYEIDERNALSLVYPTYTKEIHRDLWEDLSDLIVGSNETYKSLQARKKKKALAQKKKAKKAASAKEMVKKEVPKVPKVHKGTFINVDSVLATRARKIVKDEGVTVRNVVIEAMGDDEAVKRAFLNIENGSALVKKVETKREKEKAPSGKVLNPATNRYINADGALAKKLGLAKS